MMVLPVRKFKETLEIRSGILARLKSHRYFPITIIATLVLVAAVIHVWQRVVVISLVKEVSVLTKVNRSLVDDAHKLQSRITALSMTARVEGYAMDSLGLKRVTADQLFTLVPEEVTPVAADELATILFSIKRVAEYLPVLSQAQAGASQLQPLKFEPDDSQGGGD